MPVSLRGTKPKLNITNNTVTPKLADSMPLPPGAQHGSSISPAIFSRKAIQASLLLFDKILDLKHRSIMTLYPNIVYRSVQTFYQLKLVRRNFFSGEKTRSYLGDNTVDFFAPNDVYPRWKGCACSNNNLFPQYEENT